MLTALPSFVAWVNFLFLFLRENYPISVKRGGQGSKHVTCYKLQLDLKLLISTV